MAKKEYEAKVEKLEDGSFYFKDYDTHVVAENVEQAKAILLEGHGIDADKDPNDLVDPEVKSEKKSETKED